MDLFWVLSPRCLGGAAALILHYAACLLSACVYVQHCTRFPLTLGSVKIQLLSPVPRNRPLPCLNICQLQHCLSWLWRTSELKSKWDQGMCLWPQTETNTNLHTLSPAFRENKFPLSRNRQDIVHSLKPSFLCFIIMFTVTWSRNTIPTWMILNMYYKWAGSAQSLLTLIASVKPEHFLYNVMLPFTALARVAARLRSGEAARSDRLSADLIVHTTSVGNRER